MPAPITFSGVYLDSTGSCLPGVAVDNEAIDRYIAPLGRASARIKRRILAENGIRTRHYATDPAGGIRLGVADMAVAAVQACMAPDPARAVGMLAAATSGGDLLLPGLASQVHGALGWRPMTLASHHGVCASGMQALADAARAVERGEHDCALVVASEAPSRLFKSSRFPDSGYELDFDAHFLRWMLSDAAGAWRLSSRPSRDRVSLKLEFVHVTSHAGDYPLCMQMGMPRGGGAGWLDHADAVSAQEQGALLLRQDIRLLPHLFDVGIHAYAGLVKAGAVDPQGVDHFLCHYSSARFRNVVRECLDKAGLSIPEARWFSNLDTRGNTGAASIFVMLDDFLRQREPQPGDRILLFVPESGRFTVAFALFEVVAPAGPAVVAPAEANEPAIPPPHDPATVDAASKPVLARLLLELAGVWHDYRSRAWRTGPVRSIVAGRFTRQAYLRWMACWIPQVREGTRWMRAAGAGLSSRHAALAELIEAHAGDEQDDYQVLFEDYRRAGGSVDDIDGFRRNPGGEALNAFLHARAREVDAVDLLGAIYIIEGTGQRLVPALLPLIRRQLGEPASSFRFLHYHGENDMAHLARWLRAVELVLEAATDPEATAAAIVVTARRTASLYLMQLEDAA